MLTLAALMTTSRDPDTILRLAASAVPSFVRGNAVGVHIDGRWHDAVPTQLEYPAAVAAEVSALGHAGGPVSLIDAAWGWAFPLVQDAGTSGYVVIAADEQPAEAERFLLDVLAQQTGSAFANAVLYVRERRTAAELREVNDALAVSVRALQRSMDIHDRLTRTTTAGAGVEGIVLAVHELTGRSVAVEDRYGTLTAWAGPGRSEDYPKDAPHVREALLRRAAEAGRPLAEGGRLIALARAGNEVLGVLALIGGEASDQVALEHGATVLALELARLRSVTDAELRLRRDLVEELLAGVDLDNALDRARAAGYDLARSHRVLLVQARGHPNGDKVLFSAVRRAARELGVGSLLASRGGAVAVLADAERDWKRFRDAVETGLGEPHAVSPVVAIGVGGACLTPADFPLSRNQAEFALRLQAATGGEGHVTVFEDLGVYRLLSQVDDLGSVEAFVTLWLGPLLDHDEAKGAQLVPTLSAYLESGGSYNKTAEVLSVHRSSLRYRLQRLREISGYDLADPDTRFNLQLACRAWDTVAAQREH
jgi:sugar diacid utilization regulator